MSRRLILDLDAEQDLDYLFDYLAAPNPTAATRYVRGLREAVPFMPSLRSFWGKQNPVLPND